MPISPDLRATRQRQLVDAAHALIRANQDAGFSMVQLAKQAGVSPATPYNLLGTKAEVLRLVVRDEFETFSSKLEAVDAPVGLDHLFAAIALLVQQYTSDPPFYAGLYKAVRSAEPAEVAALMSAEGRPLWGRLVQAAVDTGELDASTYVAAVTDVLLRNLAAVTEFWFLEGWDAHRFEAEIKLGAAIVLSAIASETTRSQLAEKLQLAQQRLRDLDAAHPSQ